MFYYTEIQLAVIKKLIDKTFVYGYKYYIR